VVAHAGFAKFTSMILDIYNFRLFIAFYWGEKMCIYIGRWDGRVGVECVSEGVGQVFIRMFYIVLVICYDFPFISLLVDFN